MIFRMLKIFLFLILTKWSFAIEEKEKHENKEQIFSAAPNNTPVDRVYMFGKPIYVRPPFVIPQRDQVASNFSAATINNDDKHLAQMLKSPTLFERRRYRDTTGNDHGTYDSIESYPTFPKKPRYPLKQCYTEETGYMCCNKDLEKVMKDTVAELMRKNWKNCNLQQLSNALQKNCENVFGTEFETLAGVDDFASKIHFYSDYVCKMEREGRVMLAYATPNRHNAYSIPYRL